ncbi:inhibitor of apoptosis protein-like [Mytilus trossulus]|uniref:inhibitor of apoptosis protein-like n=1 Tax=Mytilus trossulus TaxID=6551 RepID=UPI003003BF6F
MQSKLNASKTYEETNNLGICLKKPFNISYATVGARIRSYSNWTKTSPKPVVLADAGFYHTGTEDVVQCFYCGLKLRSWDVFDDPWVEHARHGKHCPHVRNVKGKDFSKRLNDHIEEDGTPTKQETKRSLYSDDLIYTTAAKALLSMGCYRDQDIKDSIKLFVEKNDTLDFSASDILTILQNRSV